MNFQYQQPNQWQQSYPNTSNIPQQIYQSFSPAINYQGLDPNQLINYLQHPQQQQYNQQNREVGNDNSNFYQCLPQNRNIGNEGYTQTGYQNQQTSNSYYSNVNQNQITGLYLQQQDNSTMIQKNEELGYQIPNKEFNTFKLTSDDQTMTKEEIFKGTGDEAFDQPTYVDHSYTPIIGDSSKSYFKKLYSLPVRAEVKRKVEEDIISSNKRIHLLPDVVICSLVINAHQHLGYEFDIVNIFNMFGIDPRKNNVLQLLQKVSTKMTLASNQENAFAMIVVEPSKYVAEVFEAYLVRIQYNFRDKDQIINNIKRIMLKLEEIYPPLIQNPPRECASILVFLYLRGNLDIKSRQIFNRKIFSELPGVVSTKFDACFSDMERKFQELFITNSDFMLTCYPHYYPSSSQPSNQSIQIK